MPFTKESAAKLGSKGGKGVKNKTMSAASRKRYERAAAAAEKEAVAAEAEEERAKECGLGVDEQDAASQEAFWARERTTEARARLGEGDTEEATAADSRRASARHARKAQMDGSAAEVNPSPDDLAARADAKLVLAVEEVALQEMRAFGRGWVCALRVRGRLHVYLAGDLEGDRRWIKKVVTDEAHHECTTSRKHAWLAFNNLINVTTSGLPLNLIISLRTLIPVLH
jgi:hypothetical protein